jgi:porin
MTAWRPARFASWCAIFHIAGGIAGAQPALADDIDEPAQSILTGTRFDAARQALKARGIDFGLIGTSEVLSNVQGGQKRGTVYEGKLEGFVAADLEKLMGLNGLSFYANGFQIHNTGGIARNYVGTIETISNIEALRTTRLSEIWIEQKFGEKLNLRVGQLAADTEFFVAEFSDIFITSDWPAITKANLPAGGPAYPLSTPGVRLKFEPTKSVTVLAALFNGSPSASGPEDPEIQNHYGLNFRVNDPPLAIAEMQYRYNKERNATGLYGSWRLGAWYHFGTFHDHGFDTTGLSLGHPDSNQIARPLVGNYGIYGVVDHQLYRPAGGASDSGIGMFSRISASPSDRNLISFYLDGGIYSSGMIPGRPNDKFGATFLYSQISDHARGIDSDTVFFSGIPQPIRDYQLSFEFTYRALITPGWTIQPDFQYIIHPGGNVPVLGSNPPIPVKNARVIGVRSVIKF